MARTLFGAWLVWTAIHPLSAAEPPGPSDPQIPDIRFPSGFWYQRLETLRQGSIPSMSRIMSGVEYSHFLENFRIASGKAVGNHRGPAWNDGDCYKWLEAVASLYALERDPKLLAILDQAVLEIAAAQRADGYLHTPVLIKNRGGNSAKEFSDAAQFELYNLGHLMTAACAHGEATGDESLMRVAIRAADYLEKLFHSPAAPLGRSAICPAHYMGLVDLGRKTGESKYVDLAQFLIQRREAVQDGTDDNQDRVPFLHQREVVGHAVRANYLYAGVADVLLERPDTQSLSILEDLWRDVHDRKWYITGACGALFDGASPDGSSNQKQISRTHQAYGRPYQLPNSTAHNESCASIGFILWNHRMLRLTGQAQYADALERGLYNALLATISLDGTRYFYTNTLRQLDQMPVDLRWSRQREEYIKCFCCPPNIVRTIAQVSRYAYHPSVDRLWVDLYGTNQFDIPLTASQRIRGQQTSSYPWNGQVQLVIEEAPSSPMTISLRIPGWTDSASVRINGSPSTQMAVPGTYLDLHRSWKPGDTIELEMPMRVKLLVSHPLVEETRNHVAVQRGPIVYCLESNDLPAGRSLLDARIRAGSPWRTIHDDALLGGATFLETELSFPAESERSSDLYRELDLTKVHRVACRLIPYYAWGNRGQSEMTVWIPLAR
jgi:hypothetical protein